MNTILGLILLQYTVYSLPLRYHNFEMVQSPALVSQLDPDTLKPVESPAIVSQLDQDTLKPVQSPALVSQLDQDTLKPEPQTARKVMKKRKMDDVLLQFTRRLSPSTTRFRLPRITRRRVNKTTTTTTTPSTTQPTLPSAPVSYTYPNAIFDPFFEKQKLIQKISEYFNFTQIPTEFVPFYIWYYNVLHDKQAAERRNRILRCRHSYSPGYHLRIEILDHTVFPVPEEHQDYYVLVNDLAADTKDPTVLTFPKGVTFHKTTAMEQLLDEILYDDENDIEAEEKEYDDQLEEDSPNIFFTTRPAENTTTVITTTTPEPEPFYNLPNFQDLYQDNAPWITTTVDYYEGLSELLENDKKKIPPDQDDMTYFF
ncbi:uncharacterized protein LOC135834741 [Planococcus citri]|uniref:uncharacterized protein LOC135834741 n=1 Tax=Planococcus citri TaxID=170843 RepID=UPI0031F83450